jgi:hypothetical protein
MTDECSGKDRFGLSPCERGKLSSTGEVCGMMDCGVPPEQVCRKCGLWYCVKHFEFHFTGYPDHKEKKA